MDRKKVAIIFLIVIGVLFVIAVSYSYSTDESSSEDKDENFEVPSWVSGIGDLFGSSGDPLKPSHFTVLSGKATIKNDLITVASESCKIKIKSSKKDLRSCLLVLQEPPPKKTKKDEEEPKKPAEQKVELQYSPNDSSDYDKKAEPPVLSLGTDNSMTLVLAATGGEISFELVSGTTDYKFKYTGLSKTNFKVVSGEVKISSSKITISSEHCVIRVKASNTTLRNVELILQKPSGGSKLQVNVTFDKNETLLNAINKDSAKIVVQEKGGIIELRLKEGEPDYVLKIK